MKKIAVLTNVLIVALVAGLACSINNESGLEPNTVDNEPKTLTVADFDYAGQLHNDGLTYIRDFITELPASPTLEQKKEFVHEKSLEFININEFEGKEAINRNIETLKEISDPRNIAQNLFGYSSKDKKMISTRAKIVSDLSKANETMSPEGIAILSDFYGLMLKPLSEETNHSTFKNSMSKLVNNFDNIGYDRESFEGTLLGSMLNISMHSIKWWETESRLLEEDNFPEMSAPMHTYEYYYMLDLQGALLAHIHFYLYEETYWEWDWTKEDFVRAGAYIALEASGIVLDPHSDYEK